MCTRRCLLREPLTRNLMRETRKGGKGNKTLHCYIYRKPNRLQLTVRCPKCQSVHTTASENYIHTTWQKCFVLIPKQSLFLSWGKRLLFFLKICGCPVVLRVMVGFFLIIWVIHFNQPGDLSKLCYFVPCLCFVVVGFLIFLFVCLFFAVVCFVFFFRGRSVLCCANGDAVSTVLSVCVALLRWPHHVLLAEM